MSCVINMLSWSLAPPPAPFLRHRAGQQAGCQRGGGRSLPADSVERGARLLWRRSRSRHYFLSPYHLRDRNKLLINESIIPVGRAGYRASAVWEYSKLIAGLWSLVSGGTCTVGYLKGGDTLRLLHGHSDACLTLPSREHGEELQRSVRRLRSRLNALFLSHPHRRQSLQFQQGY